MSRVNYIGCIAGSLCKSVRHDNRASVFASRSKKVDCAGCFDFVKGYRVRGEQRVKAVVNVKRFKCDSYVSDYVFTHCRDIVDLMRRGLWGGEVW